MWVEHMPQTKWGLSRNYCHELQAPWFLLEEKKRPFYIPGFPFSFSTSNPSPTPNRVLPYKMELL